MLNDSVWHNNTDVIYAGMLLIMDVVSGERYLQEDLLWPLLTSIM